MKADRKGRGILMLLIILTLGITTFSCDDDENGKRNYVVSGNASGAQMVHAVTGSGTGTFTGTYNPNTKIIEYTNTWSGLSGPPTGGGFYHGAMGVSGTAVGTPWSFDAATTTASGTHSGRMKLTPTEEEQLLAG